MEGNSVSNTLIQSTISTLELVELEVKQLFGDYSENEGLLATRSEYLQQFNILSATIHQQNTINWLNQNSSPREIFDTEIMHSKFRAVYIQQETLKTLRQKLEVLEHHLAKIKNNKSMIDQFIFLASNYSSQSYRDKTINQSIQAMFYSDKSKQKVIFNLEEIRSKVLNPALQILSLEINAGNKLLDLFDTKSSFENELSQEEIARTAEIISWGFETNPTLLQIQSISKEISTHLRKELTVMKSIHTRIKNSKKTI